MKTKTAAWRFFYYWLVSVTAGVILFGIGMVVMRGPTRHAFSLLAYATPSRIDGFGESAVAYAGLAHAVLGGVLIGWGVALLGILAGPFRRGSRDAWLTVAISIGAWFIPDTGYSLWSGFWRNAALNLALGALFAIPLAGTHSWFGKEQARPAKPGGNGASTPG
jgi:hypothetical protein